MQACSGIKVLEVGRGFDVAALCGQLFAGLGASVKSVELEVGGVARQQPGAIQEGSYLSYLLQAGKETLRLENPVGASDPQLEGLIDWADVVLVDRDGGGAPELLADLVAFAARWPAKILCAISLCGAGSSHPTWRGNELIAEAAGALMSCTGYPDRPPVTSGLPYALHTTALFALSGVMAALWERERSARGQTIDLAVVDCIVALLGNFLPSYFLSGRVPQRIGNRHTIAAPWNLYPAADGSVVICTGTGGTGWWAKVMAALGQPDLVDDPRYVTEADRVRNVEEVDAIVSAWTRRRTMAQIVEQMTAQGVPVSEIGTLESVLSDPHYRDLRRMVLPSALRSGGGQALPISGTPLKVGGWYNGAVDEERLPPKARDRSCAAAEGRLFGRGERRRGPLAGLRILEFASRTSVPLAGRLLVDLGAEVVKIEPGKGDALRGAGQRVGGASYLFHINNAGKRSVVIEPSHPNGRRLILDLVGHADVFIENLAPGSLSKLGLDYGALKSANPDIIYCSASGFGERSNYGEKRALDTVVQAACGLMHMTGYPDHFPVKMGISAIDLATAVAVMASVLAGLRERLVTGKGSHIDLAMADIGVWMTQRLWPQMLCAGGHPIRQGNRSAENSPHDIFPTHDGRFVAIAIETDAQWRSLLALMGDGELAGMAAADAATRLREHETITRAVSKWTAASSAERIAEQCQSRGVPAAPVRDLAALVSDPDVTARNMIVNITHPTAGPIRLLGNPIALSRTPPAIAGAAPLLGQHTREILAGWLGLPPEQLQSLSAAGTIVACDLPHTPAERVSA